SWATNDKEAATQKAKSLINAAVERVVHHQPLDKIPVDINPATLVVGGGITGITAALELAEGGNKVYLVDKEPSIGGHMAQIDKTFPTLDCSACILTPKMSDVGNHPNIELMTYSEVESVDGYIGNFSVAVNKKTSYVNDKCTACSDCEEICPVSVSSEFDVGIGTRTAIYRPFPQAIPNTYTLSKTTDDSQCVAGCPIHQNAHGYISLIAQGKYEEAVGLIVADNPLPGICGRACAHLCEDVCDRGNVDEPISIAYLKRFAMDKVGDYELQRPENEQKQRVGIVGAGPSGLACAYDLRKNGYQVKIFDALPTAGGMLTVGIPEYRLPKEQLKKEIGKIKDIGVEFKLNTKIGQDITLKELEKQFDAVYVATGAHEERKIGIPGENQDGVLSGIKFLRDVRLGNKINLGENIIVVGGGDSAIDTARTAKRLGAKNVTIVYRRSRKEMPAAFYEIEEAMYEGISIEFLTNPVSVNGNNKVQEVTLQRMKLGTPDDSGRRRPIPIEGSEFDVPCDNIIITIGQRPDIGPLLLKTNKWGSVEVDQVTLQTSRKKVFAGGDCVVGPDTIVGAMAQGKTAAESIHRMFQKLDMYEGREKEGAYYSNIKVDLDGRVIAKRARIPTIPLEERDGFKEVNLGFTEEQAQREANRCLHCSICCDCHLCETVCQPNAIDYSMEEETVFLNVGNIIVATGYQLFDSRRIPQYGYGRLDNVFTSFEFERMITASGPTEGHIVLRDRKTEPKSVAIVHCVGSRDLNYNEYCSKVCCMYSIKFAHLVHEHLPNAEVYNLYIDMRTPGKGYEEFYHRLLEEGTHFIRGRVAEISDAASQPEEEGKLMVQVENTLIGKQQRIPVDMVILSAGMEAQADSAEVSHLFKMGCDSSGFFNERHPKLAPVATMTEGVFIAGACQGPKDIPDSVAQGGAAASQVASLIGQGTVMMEPVRASIREDDCSGCRICNNLCPYSAIEFIVDDEVSEVITALCQGCGTCVAACPSNAIDGAHFTNIQVISQLQGMLWDVQPEPEKANA
ncbi:MAG: FAD-dependent oxidoreductase, partial [Anaerolineales bacterium]